MNAGAIVGTAYGVGFLLTFGISAYFFDRDSDASDKTQTMLAVAAAFFGALIWPLFLLGCLVVGALQRKRSVRRSVLP